MSAIRVVCAQAGSSRVVRLILGDGDGDGNGKGNGNGQGLPTTARSLSADHHTPWGIVHGGVYSSAIESAASIGASASVRGREVVAVGLTTTTRFLRSGTSGIVTVQAVALNRGRTQQLWQVDVNDGSGRLLAHGEVRPQNVSAARG